MSERQQLLAVATISSLELGDVIRPGQILNWAVMAVVLIAAIIGFLSITRGTAVRRVRGARGSSA